MADPRGIDTRLRLARKVFSPSEADQLRVRLALGARLNAEGAATEAANAPRASTARAMPCVARARVQRPLQLVAVGAASFVLGYWFAETRRPDGATRATHTAEWSRPEAASAAARVEAAGNADGAGAAPSLQAAAAPEAPSSPEAAGAPEKASDRSRAAGDAPRPPSFRAHRRSHGGGASGATAADAFADELALLRRAERATRSGDAALARSLIAELEAGFPQTALRQERAALLVLAACAAHEPAAQANARVFTESQPESVYIDRIRSACKLEATSTSDLQRSAADSDAK